mgnify:CR=1 FL=1
MYDYQFPQIADKPKRISGQILKVLEESDEIRKAATKQHILEETLDTIQACETLLSYYPKWEVDEMHDLVVEKNAKRGYY